MADKAPEGGIRYNQFIVLSAGAHVTPDTIDIKVYQDHQATADANLSAEAVGNLQEIETGVYRYSYSVAGIGAGTHLLEEVRVKVLPSDDLKVWHQFDCFVEGVISGASPAVSTDSLTFKLSGKSC